MNKPCVSLGAFALEHRIAYGGMGEIWRGHHRHTGTPVAIKVLTGDYLRKQEYHEDFKREVQAVAGLHHPNVIMVHDFGELPATVEAHTDGELVAGSPYLVMELSSRGSLDRIRLPLRWLDFSRIVQGLLSALAHAHAHGIVHRDIKPGNVLLGSTDDARPNMKLTDFGIAHSIHRHRPSHADASPHGTVEDVLGTPWYMAPEQLTGHWRDYGPWTDLYAFGIVAWELATGDVPFDGESPFEIGMAHLEKRLPKFEPRLDAPDGLTDWMHGLLEKEHRDRFQSAADALTAFIALGDPRGSQLRTGPQFRVAPQTQRELDPRAGTAVDPLCPDADVESQGTTMLQPAIPTPREQTPSFAYEPVAAPPHDWRTLEANYDEQTFVGAGLGLVGWRRIPFVGRESERDILWGCMHFVRRSDRPRVVALRGPAGIGKSRLAEWLATRTIECGAANVLHVRHDETSATRSGFARTFAEHFRLIGLAPSEARSRLRTVLSQLGSFDPLFVDEVTDLLIDAIEPSEDEPVRSFSGRAADRHRLFVRLLQLVSRVRPVVVIVDDVHGSTDTLTTIERVLDDTRDESAPTLLVLTAREEEMARNDAANGPFRRLLARDEVVDLQVGPLNDEETSTLLDRLLLLSPALRDEVVQRINGNPLFAVQLISDWIEDQRLDATTAGFDLVDDDGISLPDNLHTVWLDRLQSVLRDERDRVAVELAATLGREFTTTELAAACEATGTMLPVDLIARLVNARLCSSTESGWTFAHAMLREAVRRDCGERGAWPARNSTCADMLEQATGLADAVERRARHLHAAHRWDEAVDALWLAARDRNRRGEPARAHELVELRRDALEHVSANPDDPRLGAGWALAANVLLRLQRLPEAERLARLVVERDPQGGWAEPGADAHDVLAYLARSEGNLSDARTHSERALHLYESAGHQEGGLRARLNLGYTELAESRADAALKQFQLARDGFAELSDTAGTARAEMASGKALTQLHRTMEASDAYARAQAGFEEEGLVALARECQVALTMLGASEAA